MIPQRCRRRRRPFLQAVLSSSVLLASHPHTLAHGFAATAADPKAPPPVITQSLDLPATTDIQSFNRQSLEDKYEHELSKRWSEVLRITAPLVSQTARLWASGKLRRDDPSLATATRRTLTDLGPAFVKLGQILSVREDVLGPVWSAELALLQNSVEAFGGRRAIDDALSADSDMQRRLVSFDPEPVAVASIAQVHRGKWLSADGTTTNDVAIKVLRPNVANQVGVDLCVLLRAGEVMSEWVPRILPVSQVDWQALLGGLAGGLWEEVDLQGEAERQIRFGKNMDSVPRVFVPEVMAYNRNVVLSEWVDGIPLREIPSMDDRLKEAQTLMRDAYCQSMYVDAFFHADGHGGNLLWVENMEMTDDEINSNYGESSRSNNRGELCIIDCGLMVDIKPSAAEGLLRLSLHLASRDWTRVVDDVIALGFLPEDLSPNLKAEARGIARRIIGPYLDIGGGARAASAYSISALFDDVSSATMKLPTSLPPDMILLARAVVQLEGLALRAYPNYRLVDDILPVAARIALRSAPPSSSDLDRSTSDDGARQSLLLDLLYEDSQDVFGERGSGEKTSFSPERFLRLLGTAHGSSGGRKKGQRQSSLSVGELVEELLQANAARDLVAQETSNVLDVMIRDTIWKGVDTLDERGIRVPIPPMPPLISADALPPPLKELLETIAPRVSDKEQLLLVRLLDSINGLNRDPVEKDGDAPPTPSQLLSLLPSIVKESPLVKAASIPGVSESLRDVSVAAVFRGDTNARGAIDAVGDKMCERLSDRLAQTGLSRELASTISGALLRRPWSSAR